MSAGRYTGYLGPDYRDPETYQAALRIQAEDMADAFGQLDRLEELCREHGFEVRIYAKGQAPDAFSSALDQPKTKRSTDA